MIRIFNITTGNSIKIDDDPNIHVSPKDYNEDNPHIEIKLEFIDFMRHSINCENCKSFTDSFNTNTTDWWIEYLDKTKRLNLESFGNCPTDNICSHTISDYFNGTILKLNIDTDTIKTLQRKLEISESNENYKECSMISKKINSLKKLNGNC